jgi:hypothetical protein
MWRQPLHRLLDPEESVAYQKFVYRLSLWQTDSYSDLVMHWTFILMLVLIIYWLGALLYKVAGEHQAQNLTGSCPHSSCQVTIFYNTGSCQWSSCQTTTINSWLAEWQAPSAYLPCCYHWFLFFPGLANLWLPTWTVSVDLCRCTWMDLITSLVNIWWF